MSLDLIDPTQLFPASFDTTLVDRINSLILAFSSLGSGSTGIAGVVGNGIVDDRPAIQAAIDAANAAGGGDLFLPKGTYRVTQKPGQAYCLNLPANVRLRGLGAFTTIQKDASLAGTSGQSVFTLNIQGNNTTLSDIVIDGNRQSIGWDANFEHQAGVFVQASDQVLLSNVEIKGCGGDGVQMYNSTINITVDKCYIHDNNRQGISMTSGNSLTPVQGVKITKCRIINNAIHAIDSEPGGTGYTGDVNIFGCYFDQGTSTQYAIAVGGGQNWTISGCRSRGTIYVVLSSDITISGNVIEDIYGGGAIFCYEKNQRVTANGNCLRSTHSMVGTSCLRIEAVTGGNMIFAFTGTGNTIDCSSAPADCIGFLVKGANDITFKGNTLIGAGISNGNGNGIHLRSVNVSEPFRLANVGGNTIRNFGHAAINIAGNSTAQILYLNASENVFEDTTGTMTIGISLDDGTHPLQAFDVCNNRAVGGVSTPVANTPAGSTTVIAGVTGNTGWIAK